MSARRKLTIALLLGSLALVASAAAQPISQNSRMFFSGVVGRDLEKGGNRVLLRWYTLEGVSPFAQYSIYRKAGDKNAPGPYEKITVVGKIRNINTIRSFFERTNQLQAHIDLMQNLESITGQPIDNNNYATKLIEILDSSGCTTCGFQNTTFAQVNYGVAVVEGLGYVDPVGSGLHTYEFWSVNPATGADDQVLGRVTINADVITHLPPPRIAYEVMFPDQRGHKTVYLKWDIDANLGSKLPLMFGFNVYRYPGTVPAGTDLDDLMGDPQLVKRNKSPLIILSATPDNADATETYYFADDNLERTDQGLEGIPFNVGDKFTYFVAPRDLFGQTGEGSNPVEVTVRDQLPPEIPRNLAANVIVVSASRRIQLRWQRNADDADHYNIYRYRSYEHAGQKGPFASVDGTTEGYLTLVAQTPVSASPVYLDMEIDEHDHEGRTYWYCVSAVDPFGNESALTAPVRGVLLDVTPPPPPDGFYVCVQRLTCTAQWQLLSATTGVRSTTVIFHVTRDIPEMGHFMITRQIGNDPRVIVADQEFPSDPNIREVTAVDSFINVFNEHVNYELTLFDSVRSTCGTFKPPTVFQRHLDFPGIVHIGINAGGRVTPRCEDVPGGRVPTNPTEGGEPRPTRINFPDVPGADGFILYRCLDYGECVQICEVANDPPGGAFCDDFFIPNTPTVVCYGAKSFDKSRNLSPMVYSKFCITMPGLSDPLIPVVQNIVPAGDQTDPQALVTWFGPKSGVGAYTISFATDVQSVSPIIRLERNRLVSECTYDEDKSLFSTIVDYIHEPNKQPISLNTVYDVMVVAHEVSGATQPSLNSKKFIWTDEPLIDTRLKWPVRPRPATSSLLLAAFMAQLPGTVPIPGGNIILLSNKQADIGQDFFPFIPYKFPFVLYRLRTDIPNQQYQQISPLFYSIKTGIRFTITDPFFVNLNGLVFYLDNAALVRDGTYVYKLISYSPTGELQTVYGPSNPVTVNF